MSALPSIPHLSLPIWFGIAAVVVLLGLLLAVRVSSKRNMVASSATADLIVYHLSRIADALEHERWPRALSERAAAEARPADPPPAVPARQVGLSMFGR
jgi:hypothetical protein